MQSNSYLTQVLILACSFLFIGNSIYAQNLLEPALDKSYKHYQLETIQTDKLYSKLKDKSSFHQISMTIGQKSYELQLWDSGMMSADYKVTLASGKKYTADSPAMLKGHIMGDLGADVRLTVNDGFLFGYLTIDGKKLNVQPASYHDSSADRNLMVFYYDEDAYETLGQHSCSVDEQLRKGGAEITQDALPQKMTGLCYEIELAMATDWSMIEKHGSGSAAENHVAGIMNAMESNYDDSFGDEILFDLTDFFVSDCATCDPWTSSLDIGSLLNDFSGWAPSNFGSHHIGSLWSARSFSGSAVGVAWLGGACGGFGYNVCEDFTNNGNLLRVVLAHEIGHNLNAEHDGAGGLIMSPSVSNTSSWSNLSMTDIEAHLAINTGCFIDCSNGNPPKADFDYDVLSECVPGEVAFFDDSDDAASWLWSFPGGTPSTSTDPNPVVLYHNAGIYDVTLEVTNPFGSDTEIETDAFEISDFPDALFDYDTDELDISFFDQSTGGSLTHFWDFGDGFTSVVAEPDHSYNLPGTYTVLLEVQNICDVSSFTQDIIIYDKPSAQFSVDFESGCALDQFNFDDQSYGNITDWLWTFPGGNPATSTLENPQVTYAVPGFYDVTLQVFNPEGESTLTKSNFINIIEPPLPEFEYEVFNNTVTFTNTTEGSHTYMWEFGDGNTSTITSPVHTYAGSGNYVAILIAENICGTQSQAATIAISIEPIAQIGISSNSSTSGCATHQVSFEDNSGGSPTAWNWTFPGGNPSTSTLENPVVNYGQQGNYAVTLIASNAYGVDSITLPNYVVVDDVPQLTAAHNSNLLTTSFSSTTSNATSVSWNFGDGNSSSLASPVHTYAVAGTYNASVSASNTCGTVTENLTVTVTENPIAAIGSNLTSGCAPLTVNYIDNSTGNPTSWSWSFPGGTPASSTERHPIVTYTQQGNYDVSLQVSNVAGSDITTLNQYLEVNTGPQLSANYTSTLLAVDFSSAYSNASSVSWNFGDGSSSVEDNPRHEYGSAGTYTATVVASNPCGTVTETLTVTVDLGPTAGINADVRSGCAPLTVNFQDASTANTTNWNWRFPGGSPSSSTEQNPTVTYATAGRYDVTLNASNPQGSDNQTWTEFIEVNTTPPVSYDYEVVGNVVNLINTAPGTTASWSISDGATSTLQNFVHTLRSNGTYQVTLESTNNCGSDQVTFDVVIDAYPSSGFEIASSASGCAPLTVEYTNTASQATSYLWNFPGGNPSSSADPNPVVVYSSPGIYDAILQVTNLYGFDTSNQPSVVTVTDVPEANFQTDSNGSMIRFSNTSSDATSYSWDFGDSGTSTLENPTHTYSEAGSYVVSFTATNDCGSSTLERVVVVDFSLPMISSSFSVNSGCAPLEVQITDQSSNNPTSWFWEFPGGNPATSTEKNPLVSYDTPGSYTITAVVSNPDGSSSIQYTDAIIVVDVPLAEFNLTQDSENITVTNNSVGAISYSWDFGDGTVSNEAEPNHSYTANGDYVITLSATNECGTIAYSETVTIVDISTSIVDFQLNWNWTLAPNPAVSQVSLIFESPTVQDVNYEILDLMGKTVSNGHLSHGTTQEKIELQESGIYLVVLRQGALLDVKRLVVVK